MNIKIKHLIALCSVLSFLSTPFAFAEDCLRKTIEAKDQLFAPTSGVWLPAAQELAMVDVYRERIVGARDGSDLRGDSMTNANRWPFLIRPGDSVNDFFMELTGPEIHPEKGHTTFPDRIYRVSYQDESFSMQDAKLFIEPDTRFHSADRSRQLNILELYDWHRFGAGFLAFLDFTITGRDATQGSGFFFLEDNGKFTVVHELADWNSLEMRHYTRPEPYIAVVDPSTAIVLILAEGSSQATTGATLPHLLRVTASRRGIQTEALPLPRDYASPRPTPPTMADGAPFQGQREEFALLQSYEQAAMVHSLYAQNGHVFLLAKGEMVSDAKKATAWELLQIDGLSGEVRHRTPVFTTAAHLSAVPGDSFWAFYERLPVSHYGPENTPMSEVESVLLMPSAWLEGSQEIPTDVRGSHHCQPASDGEGNWLSSALAH